MGFLSGFRQAKARDRPAPEPEPRKRVSLRRVGGTGGGDFKLSNSEIVYGAVTRIANAMATMPLHLYHGYEVASAHPLETILALRPSLYYSSFTFRQTMEANRNVEGRAYAMKVIDPATFQVVGLRVLDPTYVEPRVEEATGELWYIVNAGLPGGAVRRVVLHSWYVIALAHMSTNGFAGIRPLDVLRGTQEYDAAVRKFSLKQMEGVNGGIVIESPETMGEPRRKKMMEEFVRLYEETDGNIMSLDAGQKLHVLTRSPVDQNVLDVDRVSRSRVALVYQLPPHMVGDYQDASFQTLEQQNLEFLSYTLLPIVEQWQQELDFKLLTAQERAAGYHFRFDVEALLRGDMSTRAEVDFKAVRSGWKRPNEIRAERFMPPDPDGDQLLVSKDLAPLGSVVSGMTLDKEAREQMRQSARKGEKVKS